MVFNELCVPISTVVETSFFGFTNKKDPTQFVVFNQQGLRDAGSDLIEGLYKIIFLQKKLQLDKKKLHDFLSELSNLATSSKHTEPQKHDLE